MDEGVCSADTVGSDGVTGWKVAGMVWRKSIGQWGTDMGYR